VEEEPVQLRIDAFKWDENNISHRHDSATVKMIDEARDNHPILLPNRPGHAATHVMIGITDTGLHLYVLRANAADLAGSLETNNGLAQSRSLSVVE
jgi:hypothetical protein